MTVEVFFLWVVVILVIAVSAGPVILALLFLAACIVAIPIGLLIAGIVRLLFGKLPTDEEIWRIEEWKYY